MHRFRRHGPGRWGAALLPLATILFVLWPNLNGSRGIGTETVFDLYDPLFGNYATAQPRSGDDSSPFTLDWPRDRRLIQRVRQGHFDLWNPVPGNGMPLAPDEVGLFSPLRLVLYAAPVPPYTAFVLFRIVRLLLAAIGAFLLARSYSLSQPASVIVSIAFGLSGGMVSQLPFATVESVCWLPWICWTQVRSVRRAAATCLVPHALVVAAALTGGHQPIAAATVLGGLCHALGLAAVQPGWRDRRRVALLMAKGYGLGLLLAAPAILPFAELLRNGYTYKTNAISAAFQAGSVSMNRFTLFPAAIMPRTIDALRDGVLADFYPYTLDFCCGVTVYLLAAVAVVWRRWRCEWLLMWILGIAICFAPLGLQWIATAPFIRDIQGRYAWSLFVLPIIVAAGFGVDAIQQAGEYRRGPLFVPLNCLPGRRSGWPRDGLTTTIGGAVGVLALLAFATALLMWTRDTKIAAGVFALLGSVPGQRLNAFGPFVGAIAALVICAWWSRAQIEKKREWQRLSGLWLLALAVCAEVAFVAVPHLREAPSRQVREPQLWETASLATQIDNQHTRVGGQSEVVVGFGGWRELRAHTPIAPLRYARFLQAANGPEAFTEFNVPTNRSPLIDLAAVGYLIVGSSDAPNLEGDRDVVHVADIRAVSIYENRGALPRARLVHRTIAATTIDDAAQRLTSLTGGAAHVTETPLDSAVILEPTAAGQFPLPLAGGPATSATFIVDDADRVVIHVDAAEPGYLVLADTHYPGWKATVDGQDRPIYPANVGFRAVYVDQGRHTVAFKFQPTSVRIGLGCTLVGLLLCARLLARPFRHARRSA